MHKLYIFATMFFGILTVQCAEQGLIKSMNNQVDDLVFADHSRFGHEDLMAFGLTCHSNDAYLRATSQKRKNYFLVLMPMALDRCNYFQWHKYGSRADRKKIISRDTSESSLTKKKLCLERVELAGNAKIYKYSGKWDDFEAGIVYCPTPFLDKDKQVCFFGYGYMPVPYSSRAWNIIHYSMLRILENDSNLEKSSQLAMRCLFSYDNTNEETSLAILLGLPYLLKSILDSQGKKIYRQCTDTEKCYFLYDIKNIVLLNNYKVFVKHESLGKTFDELPEKLKNALIQKYEQQKNNDSL